MPVKFEFIDSDLLDLDELDEVGDTTRSEESVFNCGGGIGAFLVFTCGNDDDELFVLPCCILGLEKFLFFIPEPIDLLSL